MTSQNTGRRDVVVANPLRNCCITKLSYSFTAILCIFTALHAMQTRSSDDNSVRPSVRLSVCHTRVL